MCLHIACTYMLVLAVNSECFQILQSYNTLLLKPPILMRSWQEQLSECVMLVLVKLQHGRLFWDGITDKQTTVTKRS